MHRHRHETWPPHDDWIEQFKQRATPRLRNLFTSNHDFTALPETIAEPLRRLAAVEQQRG